MTTATTTMMTTIARSATSVVGKGTAVCASSRTDLKLLPGTTCTIHRQKCMLYNYRIQNRIPPLDGLDLVLSCRTDSTDSRTILCFYSAQRRDLFARCVRLSRLSVIGFRTHFKSTHFHYMHSFILVTILTFSWRQTTHKHDTQKTGPWPRSATTIAFRATGNSRSENAKSPAKEKNPENSRSVKRLILDAHSNKQHLL